MSISNGIFISASRVCVVETDVLTTSSIESPVDKKDSILVAKFKEAYPKDNYVIQDEKIGQNLFQVMGIKEQKVREVYALMSSTKVEVFIPYAMALRQALINAKAELTKGIAFVDVQAGMKFLTVFYGLLFSRTRIITDQGDDLLSEIKRSQIDFAKMNKEYLDKASDFIIMTNDRDLALSISVQHLDQACPAMQGLKLIDTPVKYKLPEEELRIRKEKQLSKRIQSWAAASSIIAIILVYFLWSKLELNNLHSRYTEAFNFHERLLGELNTLDQETYRGDLQAQKTMNYGVSFLSILNIIPASYTVDSFTYFKKDRWNIEMNLFTDDNMAFDTIPRIKMLKNAQIKDIFINNQPGKHLKIIL